MKVRVNKKAETNASDTNKSNSNNNKKQKKQKKTLHDAKGFLIHSHFHLRFFLYTIVAFLGDLTTIAKFYAMLWQ